MKNSTELSRSENWSNFLSDADGKGAMFFDHILTNSTAWPTSTKSMAEKIEGLLSSYYDPKYQSISSKVKQSKNMVMLWQFVGCITHFFNLTNTKKP
jgi:hypothetical protein